MLVVPGANFPVTFADSPALSAFGRLSTSQAEILFESQQQYGDDADAWETAVAGTGANTFLPNESTISMSTGGTASGASVIRQTRLFHRYTPGHAITAFMTFCLGASVTNNTRRIGLFDANNGIFLEMAGSTVSICQRTYVGGSVDDSNKVAQASWNVDKFDGTGPSGVTIDWTKAQILIIDLQWLGVGRVRVGFSINGVFYPAHYFNNANAYTTVYMTTANLPLRLENTNTGTASGTATLKHICSCVTSGGGSSLEYGHQFCYNNGGAGTAITSGTRIPIISIRAKTTGPNSVRNTGQIDMRQYDIACMGTNPIFWEVVLNGTLTGAAFAALSSTHSITDVDKTASAITGGTTIEAGYLAASATTRQDVAKMVGGIKQLILSYSGLNSVQDTITLVCSAPSGNTTAFCNFQWLERW